MSDSEEMVERVYEAPHRTYAHFGLGLTCPRCGADVTVVTVGVPEPTSVRTIVRCASGCTPHIAEWLVTVRMEPVALHGHPRALHGHGTNAAWQRHSKGGTEPCAPCQEAHDAFLAARRKKRHGESVAAAPRRFAIRDAALRVYQPVENGGNDVEPLHQLAERLYLAGCRPNEDTARQWVLRNPFLTEQQADRVATAIGCHPSAIWPQWWETAEAEELVDADV